MGFGGGLMAVETSINWVASGWMAGSGWHERDFEVLNGILTEMQILLFHWLGNGTAAQSRRSNFS